MRLILITHIPNLPRLSSFDHIDPGDRQVQDRGSIGLTTNETERERKRICRATNVPLHHGAFA